MSACLLASAGLFSALAIHQGVRLRRNLKDDVFLVEGPVRAQVNVWMMGFCLAIAAGCFLFGVAS